MTDNNLVNHARRELEIIGEEPEFINGYLKVIQAFSEMGHSGGSASVAIPVINKLLQFQNISPLTDDPDEWMNVSEVSGDAMWQSRRRADAFSRDGGKTYYLLQDLPTGIDNIRPTYASKQVRKEEDATA